MERKPQNTDVSDSECYSGDETKNIEQGDAWEEWGHSRPRSIDDKSDKHQDLIVHEFVEDTSCQHRSVT